MDGLPATRPHDLESDYFSDRLKINISGAIYETRERTLARYPESLLGDPTKRQPYYCPHNQAYFFNRHRKAFESILYYYQSGGRLVLPRDIPLRLFFEEVEFFGLGDDALCLVSKGLFAGKRKMILENTTPSQPIQNWLWEMLERPESSTHAKVLSIFCIIMIVLSIILSCLTTAKFFQEQYCVKNCNEVDRKCCKYSQKPIKSMVILDLFCYIWFLLEYVCRLLSAPSKKHFFLSFLNFIDVIVVVPFFITYFINMRQETNIASSVRLLSLARIFRLARIVKLARYSHALRVLGSTLKASLHELKMMMMFLFMAVIVSSCTVYLAELKTHKTTIHSIPDAFWWAITTITTVGYGDIYPISASGKFVGSVCTIIGALAFSLPVIVFATNFRACYKTDTSITAEYHRNLKDKTYTQRR